MENKKLTEQESLELIAQMIQNSKQNFEKGNGNTFIIFGVSTLITTVLVGTLLYYTQNQAFNWLWMLIPLIGNLWMHFSKKGEAKVYTQIDRMVKQLWIIITGIAVGIPLLFAILVWRNVELLPLLPSSKSIFILLPFLEILICSIGLAITGAIIDFKTCKFGGQIGVVLSFGTLIVGIPFGSISIFALWSIVTMIIPGMKLNHYIKKEIHHAERT